MIVLLVPGLLVRHEYTESLFARILVTFGVICLRCCRSSLPDHGEIPLVAMFKGLIERPATGARSLRARARPAS